jgi:hypothetical protein
MLWLKQNSQSLNKGLWISAVAILLNSAEQFTQYVQHPIFTLMGLTAPIV